MPRIGLGGGTLVGGALEVLPGRERHQAGRGAGGAQHGRAAEGQPGGQLGRPALGDRRGRQLFGQDDRGEVHGAGSSVPGRSRIRMGPGTGPRRNVTAMAPRGRSTRGRRAVCDRVRTCPGPSRNTSSPSLSRRNSCRSAGRARLTRKRDSGLKSANRSPRSSSTWVGRGLVDPVRISVPCWRRSVNRTIGMLGFEAGARTLTLSRAAGSEDSRRSRR